MSALLAVLAGDAAAAQNGTPPTLLRASELRRSNDADVDGAPSVALAAGAARTDGRRAGWPVADDARSGAAAGAARLGGGGAGGGGGVGGGGGAAARVGRREVEAVGRAVAGVAAAEAGWAALCRRVTAGCCGGGIVFVTPEMGRWGSVGGLGHGRQPLARARRAGLDITVIAPAYRSLASGGRTPPSSRRAARYRRPRRERCAVGVLTDRHDKVRLLLLALGALCGAVQGPWRRRRVARARPCRPPRARRPRAHARAADDAGGGHHQRLGRRPHRAVRARAAARRSAAAPSTGAPPSSASSTISSPATTAIALPAQKAKVRPVAGRAARRAAPAAVGAPPRRGRRGARSRSRAPRSSRATLGPPSRPATARSSSPRPPRSRRSSAPSARRLRAPAACPSPSSARRS